MFQTANLRIFFGIHADVDKKKNQITLLITTVSTENLPIMISFSKKTLKSSLIFKKFESVYNI